MVETHVNPPNEGQTIYFKDITKKEKAEQEKSEMQRRNEALVNNTPGKLSARA